MKQTPIQNILTAEYNSEISSDKARTSIIWIMPAITIAYILINLAWEINSLNFKPLIISLTVSIGCASLIQILWLKSKSIGIALLFLFLPLFFIGTCLQALAPIFTIILIAALLLVLVKASRISLKKSFYSAAAVLISGGVIALVLLQRSGMGYAQPFASATINKDTLFHVAISSMIKNYGIASTGLNGLVPLRYHVASHSVLSSFSLITNLSVLDVYNYIYPLVIIPLMLTVFLCLAEEVLPSKNVAGWIVRSIILFILLVGLGSDYLSNAAFWMSFYLSESYTLALVFLMGLFSLLLNRKKSSSKTSLFLNTIFVLLLFLLASFAKISVGFVFLGVVGSWLLLERSERLRDRLILLIGCLVLFFFTHKLASGSALEVEKFHFIKNYVIGNSFWEKVFIFSVFHLLFSHIVIIAFFYSAKWQWKEKIPYYLIFGIITSTIIGIIPGVILNIAGGSAYYFSNVSQIMALPLLIILISASLREILELMLNFKIYKLNPKVFKIKNLISNFSRNVTVAVGSSLFLIVYFALAFMPVREKEFSSLEALAGKMKQAPIVTYDSFFISELKKISKDSLTKNMMIYVPRSTQRFWNLDSCDTVGFILTALSERSALRSLPSPDCNAHNYGYENYSDGLLKQSQALDDDNVLRQEARSLGFKGVIVLSEKGTRVIK